MTEICKGAQVKAIGQAGPEDLAEFRPYGEAYAEAFGVPLEELFRGRFYLLTPNTSSPYRQLYTNQ